DGVVDLPADVPRSAHRRGCAELFLRHAAFLRSHPAVGERDGTTCPAKLFYCAARSLIGARVSVRFPNRYRRGGTLRGRLSVDYSHRRCSSRSKRPYLPYTAGKWW